MIGIVTTLVFAFALLGWMWMLELRLSRVLDHAETLVDRQHGPALPPEPAPLVIAAEPAVTQPDIPAVPVRDIPPAVPIRPSPHPREPLPATVPDGLPANGGLKQARLTAAADVDRATSEAGRITDPDMARLFADWEQAERALRASYEETTK